MNERHEVMRRLRDSGVVDGIEWAYRSATSRALGDHSEEAGYTRASLGFNRFVLFGDRLDRVFSCGKYVLDDADDVTRGLDILHAELSEEEIRMMPELSPDLVWRADLNRSPGWAFEDLRFLLASAPFGKIDRLAWRRKGKTIQQIAAQPNPEPEPSLFDDLDPEEVPDLAALSELESDLETFVVAHALDALTHGLELAFGRPHVASSGGPAWYWREDLLTARPAPGGHRIETPSLAGPDTVEDAPVRLRPAANRTPKAGEQS